MTTQTESRQHRMQTLARIWARAWTDAEFKRCLLQTPAAVLAAEGIERPVDAAVRVVEDTDEVLHLVLPVRPATLSDEDLDNVAGGIEPVTLIVGGMAIVGLVTFFATGFLAGGAAVYFGAKKP